MFKELSSNELLASQTSLHTSKLAHKWFCGARPPNADSTNTEGCCKYLLISNSRARHDENGQQAGEFRRNP